MGDANALASFMCVTPLCRMKEPLLKTDFPAEMKIRLLKGSEPTNVPHLSFFEVNNCPIWNTGYDFLKFFCRNFWLKIWHF
jgi:hypothetical protein